MFDLQVTRSEKAWRKWFDTDAPEEEHIPDGYHTTLDSFRKLLLIRYINVKIEVLRHTTSCIKAVRAYLIIIVKGI